MTDNKRTKTIELLPTTIFDAVSNSDVNGDLNIVMYEDGSIFFSGASMLEYEHFVKILEDIKNYLKDIKPVGKINRNSQDGD